MSDEKITVRDLATKLNVAPKDILRVLRELDIPARSTVSPIPPEAMGRVKERFAGEQAGLGQRREVGAGVIVRRRRPSEEVVQAAESVPAPPLETESPASPQAGAEAPPAGSKPRKRARPEAAPAKIIRRPAGEGAEPVAGPVAESRQPSPGEVPAAGPQSADRSETSAADALAAKAAPPRLPIVDKDAVRKRPDGRPDRRKTQSRHEPARVISMPPLASAAPGASGAPLPPVAHAASAMPSVAAQEAAQTGEADSAKGRRAPAASARPEGSSAPSLLPPPGEGRGSYTDEGHDEHGDRLRRRRRPAEAAAPQVRVISRPEPGDSGPGGGFDRPRPAQDHSGPGGGDRRDGFRPSAPRLGLRSPGLGGRRPDVPIPGMMPEENREGQSKKKRNKNRRPGESVDFPTLLRRGG